VGHVMRGGPFVRITALGYCGDVGGLGQTCLLGFDSLRCLVD
jgi:hypothetical protein